MASQRRLTLFQTLSALPAPQFEQLRFTLNPPARSLYQQALAILEPKLGAEHPWTMRCRENLAKVENGE